MSSSETKPATFPLRLCIYCIVFWFSSIALCILAEVLSPNSPVLFPLVLLAWLSAPVGIVALVLIIKHFLERHGKA